MATVGPYGKARRIGCAILLATEAACGGPGEGPPDAGHDGPQSTADASVDAPADATTTAEAGASPDAADATSPVPDGASAGDASPHDGGAEAEAGFGVGGEAGVDAGPGPFTLQVTRSGGGSVVDSTGKDIDCNDQCSFVYARGTVVQLSAHGDSGSTFVGWSGACTGTASTCKLVIDSDTVVGATWSSCPGAHAASWTYGGPLDDRLRAVAVDSSGNVVVAGSFEGAATFGGSQLTSQGNRDVVVAKYSSTGAPVWQIAHGGPGEDEALAVAVDGNGDVIVAGQFQRSASLGGSTFTSQGDYDVFVAKYSGASGAHLWSTAFGGTYEDAATALAVTAAGEAVVAGHFSNSMTVGTTALASAGYFDVFLAKLAPADGSVAWARSAGGTGWDTVGGIAVDGQGNVVLAGTYFPSAADYGGGPLPTTLDGGAPDPVNSSNIVVAKYQATDGAFVFAHGYPTSGQSFGTGVAADAQGNLYLAGRIFSDLSIAGGTIPFASASGGFVAKLAPDASSMAWSYGVPGYGWTDPVPPATNPTLGNADRVPQVALDPNGDVLVLTATPFAGFFGTTVQLLPDRLDFDVARLAPDGTLRWAQRFGGGGNDHGYGLAVDAQGNGSVVGAFDGTTEICDGWHPSLGGQDALLLRLVRAPPGAGAPTSLLVPDPVPPPLVPPDAGSRCAPAGPPPDGGAAKGTPTFDEVVFNAGPLPTYAGTPAIGDFTGDGTQDVFFQWTFLASSITPTSQGAAVFSNDGTGLMTDATSAVLGGAQLELENASSALAFDADGDGRMDVLLAQWGPDAWPWPGAQSSLLLQQTPGKLADATFGRLPWMRANDNQAVVADVDCNGSLDAFVNTLLYNDGAGHFTPAEPRAFPNPIGTYVSAFCDVNRDGAPDLMLAAGTVALAMMNDGFGHFVPGPSAGAPSVNGPTALVCVDVDLDGYPDVAVIDGMFNLSLWHNQHDGTFLDVTATKLPHASATPRVLVAADLNGDGWPEIVTSGDGCGAPATMEAQIFLNQGGGTFVEDDTIVPVDTGCSQLFPIDANGDGRTDLVRLKFAGTKPSSVLVNTTP